MLKSDFPENIKELFLDILQQERDYIGEKPIENGFLIKRNKDKATISFDDGEFIYAVRMIYANKQWKVVGHPSKWDNIKDLLEL